jgi:hypothetical protein
MNEWNATHLTEDWYDRIVAGADIREVLREKNALVDERTLRLQAALLIVMFERYPLDMTVDEITDAVNAQPFEVMEDGAFRMYVDELIQAKAN